MQVKILKHLSAKTYKGKDGKDHKYENYTIHATLENGKVVVIPFIPNWNIDKKVGEKLRYVAELVVDVNKD